jgi:uncharacterized membrane protein YgcG
LNDGRRRDDVRALQLSSPGRDGTGHGWLALLAAVAIAAALAWTGLSPSSARAQEAAAAPAPIPQEKLDSLLAPVALYPDDLLAQTLMAATYPLDVVEAARFVRANRELKGDALEQAVLQKNWDPSVQSLTAFPQVLEMMDEKIEWTQELGDAFLADKQRVMATVQSLRQKAEASGNLQSNEQQKVVKEQTTIIIEPAQPDVVYVPSYNPTVVYGSWWAPAYPPYYWPPPPYYYPGGILAAGMIGFGIGWAIGNNNWGWNDIDWNGGDINIDIDRDNTFINNNKDFKNKVSNGKWEHNPAQRKGVSYRDNATRERFQKSDPGAVASRRDVRGFEGAGTRDAQRPGGTDRPSAGTRDAQRPGGGDLGAGAGTRDAQRPGGTDFGAGAGTRDAQRGGTDFGSRSSTSARPSFDAGQSRSQASSFSSRGAASRSSSFSGARGGGGMRGGGGGGRR